MGFQVPRVTIKIDFKEGASFGELSLISFGYGLHQAWIYSSMFDKGGIFGTGGLQAGPFNDQLSLAYFVSILIYGLLLLIASILDTKLIRALHATPHPRCSRPTRRNGNASPARVGRGIALRRQHAANHFGRPDGNGLFHLAACLGHRLLAARLSLHHH